MTGTSINTRARNNYSEWCNPKGTGSIPAKQKVPGAAVFTYSSSSGAITHVGFLEKPVDASKPTGDWYVIEARGVMYGVVRTKLNGRSWNRWGLMTKYFDYEGNADVTTPTPAPTPAPTDGKLPVLKKGSTGSNVKTMQQALKAAGYNLGSYGVDGDFGSDTEKALKQFQKDKGLTASGQCDEATWAALGVLSTVTVTGGTVNVRNKAGTDGAILGTVKQGDKLQTLGAAKDGWVPVRYKDKDAWISAKYTK